MLDDEQDVLCCVTIDAAHAEGSVPRSCEICGTSIWLSPSGRRLQAEKNLKLVCLTCVGPDLLSGDAEIAPLNNDQRREIARELWKENIWKKGGPA